MTGGSLALIGGGSLEQGVQKIKGRGRLWSNEGDWSTLGKSTIYRFQLIYWRFCNNIYRIFSSPIYHYDISCQSLPIQDISMIYRWYFCPWWISQFHILNSLDINLSFTIVRILLMRISFSQFFSLLSLFLWHIINTMLRLKKKEIHETLNHI